METAMQSTRGIGGHLLLIDDAGQDAALPKALEQAGLRVSVIDTPSKLLTATEQDATLAGIVLRGCQPKPMGDALTALRHRNPHIPVFANIAGDRRYGVDLIRPGSPVSQVVNTIRDRLDGHHYDDRVVDAIVEMTTRTLKMSVTDLDVEATAHFVRYDARMLGRVSAMIDVMGTGLVGKVMISAALEWFETQSRAMLAVDEPNESMISDAAAEISNLLAADVRTHYLARGLDSVMGTPTVFGGSDVFVRIYSPRPSLVVRFESAAFETPFFVEWLLERKGEDQEGESPVIDSGELEFF